MSVIGMASAGNIRLSSLAWIASCSLMLLGVAVHEFRYAMYVASGIAVVVIVQSKRILWSEPLSPFVACAVVGLATVPLNPTFGAKDVFFVISGFAPLLVARTTMSSSRLWLLLFLFAVAGVVAAVTAGGVREVKIDLSASEASLEGAAAFLCGLVAVVALLRRQTLLFLVALLFVLLFLKRAALLAIACCVLFAFLPRSVATKLLRPLPIMVANALGILLALQYAMGGLDYYLVDWFGQSGNQIGLGRQALQARVAVEIYSDWRYLIFGNGIGSAYPTFLGLFGKGDANLHSDVLKIVYEFGVAFYFLLLYLAFKVRSFEARLLFLYTNVLWFTDNVLIYSFYTFFLLSFQLMIAGSTSWKASPNVVAR